MPGRTLIVGTRGSRLALEQARRVCDRLAGPSRVRVIRTSGDRFADVKLGEQQSVGFFTKEIEQELLSGDVDLAVHSLKDLPTALPRGLILGAVLERDAAGDVLLARQESVDQEQAVPLAGNARVGASSLRRQSLLSAVRSDLRPVPIRGNVTTRIEKCIRGDCDAVILSRAGLARLELDPSPLVGFDLNPRVWIGAPGQGVIAVEVRADDAEARQRLGDMEHAVTREAVTAERLLHVTFGGGCHAPFGSFAEPSRGGFRLFVAAPSRDGGFGVREFSSSSLDQARSAAEDWIRSGCPDGSIPAREEWICRPAQLWY